MKSAGGIKVIDEMGRIVIPDVIRRRIGLEARDKVEIYVEKDRIVLRKYAPGCIFCGSSRDTVTWKDKLVCKKCLDGMRRAEEKADRFAAGSEN